MVIDLGYFGEHIVFRFMTIFLDVYMNWFMIIRIELETRIG